MGRLFISAAHKSSGKTTVTLGLAAALAARGLKVQAFKKGPDYIDPMWLGRASGRPCYNLDFNTQSSSEILSTFWQKSSGADLTLIEGNKGLHDGLHLDGRDSSAALAKLVQAPVVLVIDANGMTRGVAPLVSGYAAFDASVRIGGVILNKVGASRQEAKLRQALEHYTDIPVLGAIGRDRDLAVAERHLGLTTPEETADLDAIIARTRDALARDVDLDRLLALAATAADVPAPAAFIETARRRGIRIAVARDAAFGFYYPDDLEALGRAGAHCVFFDALRDKRLPHADALFIGGGFPETQAARLAANATLRADIRRAIAAGLPTYAECGGMMYLSRSITWHGETHEMVGTIPADTVLHDRPQGRGLVVLTETADAPWPAHAPTAAVPPQELPAHEFHYAALENIAPDCRFAYRVRRGYGIDGRHDGIVIGNLLANFSHLRDTSRNHWARRFVAFVRETRHRAEVVAPQRPPRQLRDLRRVAEQLAP
ncbi:MAG: cobyrinate a,c-diamide synthase [Xanthobacteraceae bacterium]